MEPFPGKKLSESSDPLAILVLFQEGNINSMAKGSHKIRIPNLHGSEIGVSLLKEILRQAGMSTEDWDRI